MAMVEFDINKVIKHIDLENIRAGLLSGVNRIVANNIDDDAEIGRQIKLYLMEAEQWTENH